MLILYFCYSTMNLTRKRQGELEMMKNNRIVKECCECGSQFEEKHESLHFECEHCMSKIEE